MKIKLEFNVENSSSGFGCAINEFAIELNSILIQSAIININYDRIILSLIKSKPYAMHIMHYACTHTYLIPHVSCLWLNGKPCTKHFIIIVHMQ